MCYNTVLVGEGKMMKRTAHLVVVFLAVMPALTRAEAPVHFVDANLKAAVESALGISDPTHSDMLALTKLGASYKAILNLTGIEYATNLTDLDLSGDEISDFSPLSGLTNLRKLNLYNCSIIYISFLSGLTNLTELNLNLNMGIRNISVLSGLTNLTSLQLNNNRINDVSALSGLTNLTNLGLHNNQISDISALSGLTNLKRLVIGGNNISNISALSGLTNLMQLSLSENLISDISAISGLTNLEDVDIIYNQISDISHVSGLTNLRRLHLSHNNISDISAISGLTNLADLGLPNNQISDISALAGLTHLTGLDLRGNPLNSQAYSTYLPLIIANNPGIDLRYDSLDPDTEPPNPDPMTWAIQPYQTSASSIAMVATAATDPTAPIEYYFDFCGSPTGGQGGTDSGWRSGTLYIDSGLISNHVYGYKVKARDGNNNETSYSAAIYEYTDIEAPSGIAFGTITATSIETKSVNTPSGLTRNNSGLIIYNTTTSANSGWKKDNNFWTSNSLSANTQYGFRAKARNGNGDETDHSAIAYTYTLANVPGAGSFSNITGGSVRANWKANENPAGTEYLCENITKGTNSGWTTSTYWTDVGLSCGTSYSYRVKARNGDDLETDWTSLGSQSTLSCQHTLAIFSTSGGSVTIPGQGLLEYEDQAVVPIEATPETNYHFVNWTGTAVDAGKVLNPNAASTSVTVDADYTLKAHFLRAFVYVDNDAPGDPGPNDPAVSDPWEDGSYGHPFDTIQEAINVAMPGDTIAVHAGTYYENINFAGKNIILTSMGPDDPNIVANTIINGSGIDSVVTFNTGEDANCVLAGFTVVDGNAVYGGGIACSSSNPTIFNCIIAGNSAVYGGGMFSFYGRPHVINCAFSANYADYGGAILSWSDGGLRLTNCTLSQNWAVQGGAVYCWESAATITNCISWDNLPQEVHVGFKAVPTITYSDVQGGWPGQGNIDADPCFVQPGYYDVNGTPDNPDDDFWVAGDYHLLADSPCINAGDNEAIYGYDIDIDGRLRVCNGRVDIGAYEFQTDAIAAIELYEISDYDNPTVSGDTKYIFYLAVKTNATVDLVEFQTPAGKMYQIPKLSHTQAGYIETRHYADNGTHYWEYVAEFAYKNGLVDYGDGDYIITTHHEPFGIGETTVRFGVPGTTDALARPTQVPVLTFPPYNGSTTSPVIVTWQPCTDVNATSIRLALERQGASADYVDVNLPVGVTSSDSYALSSGIWKAQLSFDHCYNFINADGIPASVGKYSESTYRFEVTGGPSIEKDKTNIAFGQTSTSESFIVWNDGTGTLNYDLSISEGSDWFSVSPIGGSSTGSHDKKTHTVTVNRSSISPAQTVTGKVKIESSAADDSPQYIGLSATGALTEWTQLMYDDFESGWGSYRDGGRDCGLYTGGTYAHQGKNAANIRDNSGGSSSFYQVSGIDVHTPGYTEIKVDFWFYAYGMERGEDFWVQYYDGSAWRTVARYVSGTDFENGQFYHETLYIDEADYMFPANMRIGFRCDASSDGDAIYIDEIRVSAKLGVPDTTPPTPDPMTWATVPHATGVTSIAMLATPASDPSGVQYYFACTAGGGHDSGWQDSADYEDTGLDPNTLYSYHVKARDKSANQNETASSTVESAKTLDVTAWAELTYDDFESGWGNYLDGGRDCGLYTGGTYAHQGSNAANIRDNSGSSSSFYHASPIDIHTPGYTEIKVDFWFYAYGMERGEDFWVQYYDGSAWRTVARYVSGTDFKNNQFYHKIVQIDEAAYAFPTNMKIRFLCDASSDGDSIYIDAVRLSAH